MLIDDGRGKGYSARVDNHNRLYTRSVSQTDAMAEAELGNVFQFTTGIISLTTTGAYTALMYVKNDDPVKNVYVEIFRFGSGAAGQWKVTKNPTTGTIITAGTDMPGVNTRFDSGNAFNGISKKGSNGQTITDGDLFAEFPGQSTFIELGGIIIVTPGTAISVSYQPSVATVASATAFMYQK
jgi:hypothetical protein